MKTNFQDGTIVTPAFLNAINSPVWKQAPANDGEIKPPVLADMPDVEQAIVDAVEAERQRAIAAEGSISFVAAESFSNKSVYADTSGVDPSSTGSLIQIVKLGSSFFRFFGWAYFGGGAPAFESGVFGSYYIDSDPATLLRSLAAALSASPLDVAALGIRGIITVSGNVGGDCMQVPVKLRSSDGLRIEFVPYHQQLGLVPYFWQGNSPHVWWSFEVVL